MLPWRCLPAHPDWLSVSRWGDDEYECFQTSVAGKNEDTSLFPGRVRLPAANAAQQIPNLNGNIEPLTGLNVALGGSKGFSSVCVYSKPGPASTCTYCNPTTSYCDICIPRHRPSSTKTQSEKTDAWFVWYIFQICEMLIHLSNHSSRSGGAVQWRTDNVSDWQPSSQVCCCHVNRCLCRL